MLVDSELMLKSNHSSLALLELSSTATEVGVGHFSNGRSRVLPQADADAFIREIHQTEFQPFCAVGVLVIQPKPETG